MATLLARPHEVPSRSTTPVPLPPHLTLNTSFHGTPTAVPNKHIPYSSPGPALTRGFQLPSPPDSPPSKEAQTSSLLYPPDQEAKLHESPPIFGLTAASLAAAIDHAAKQPLPEAKFLFPWSHGLHPDNQMQLAFFNARRRQVPPPPSCFRGLTLVKAGNNLTHSKLVGAVAPDELLVTEVTAGCMASAARFKDIDPKHGFNVRNFHIQACKLATVSDIVVYGDDLTPRSEIEQTATMISMAQRIHAKESKTSDRFNTFVVMDPFSKFAEEHPEVVALDTDGCLTGRVVDFSYQERFEMCSLSKASEIAKHVWLGPTPDPAFYGTDAVQEDLPQFDILIETTDFARMPTKSSLKSVASMVRNAEVPLNSNATSQVHLEFPSSGSIAAQNSVDADIEDLIAFCQWMYEIVTQGEAAGRPVRILLHCADGYTETSMLALAYFMFVEGIPAHDAWIRLHHEKGRDFFAYASDKVLLEHIQDRILARSPALRGKTKEVEPCEYSKGMDGSLPSRIRPYLYLGNLHHAQNPAMLRALGITRLLSVGEPISWDEDDVTAWGEDNFLYIDKVQDNGVDPLTSDFEKCLDFIGKSSQCSSHSLPKTNKSLDEAKASNHATLVHCRVGVSRSATICIAQVMKELGLSLPRAYCYVRARRLNVIIQPHLRFMYELLKWEELQLQRRGEPLKRELEWVTICREIALINKPYRRT